MEHKKQRERFLQDFSNQNPLEKKVLISDNIKKKT